MSLVAVMIFSDECYVDRPRNAFIIIGHQRLPQVKTRAEQQRVRISQVLSKRTNHTIRPRFGHVLKRFIFLSVPFIIVFFFGEDCTSTRGDLCASAGRAVPCRLCRVQAGFNVDFAVLWRA